MTEIISTTSLAQAARILRLPEVMARVGLKRATVYLHITQGSFPKPISLGPRAVGWLESEIDAWITARIEVTRNGKDLTAH